MVKPIVVTSACLGFEKLRYNGQSIPSPTVKKLAPFVEFIKVCPEYEIGLGVPREPIRIVKVDDEYRLIQHKTNRDVTDDMNNFTNKFMSNLKEVDGFIFKSKSPTMGIDNIKVYAGIKGGSPVVDRGGGFFAGTIAKYYEGYPLEDNDRLRNKKIRHHFFTKLFLFAHYRLALKNNNLEEFHENNKLLFRFYNVRLWDKMDYNKKDYFEIIKRVMIKPPAAEEIYEFFKNLIEDKYNILKRYRENKLSFEVIKEASRFLIKDDKLLKQTFYSPYPEELIWNVEEDRRRDYWKNNDTKSI